MGAVVNFKDKSLAQVLDEFHRQFGIALDHDTKGHGARLKAASLLKDMRKRVDGGEAGDITWWKWFRENSVRSRRDAERLLKLANSENPEAAYEEEKEKDRERKQNSKAQPEGTTENDDFRRDLDDSDENVSTENSWPDDNRENQRCIYRDALHLIDQMDDDTFTEFLTELKKRGLI